MELPCPLGKKLIERESRKRLHVANAEGCEMPVSL